MSFVIRVMGGVVILIRVAKQNGYESCQPFNLNERSVKSVNKENARGMQDDTISRQAVKELAHKQVREKYCGMALKEHRDFYIKLADSIIDLLPSTQPYTIYSDGRLWITVDDIDKVRAVVVDEHKSKFCKQFYEDAQPEIVRCKDCKHYEYGICNKTGLCVNKSPNGFCDWGERREVTT